MNMHVALPLFLALVASIVLLRMLATRLQIAYPILLVVAGLAISFIPGLPVWRVNPDMIFFIFLPPLLFEAAWSISFKEMRKWWRIISSFAFLVVFFTAFSVALITNHFIPGFTIAIGFLLGGIVSPPDAVSTGAITKFVKIPRATATILEGESLLNDASSLIIFRFALIAIGTGQLFWHDAAMSFIWMITGGAAIGLIVAWLFVQLHKKLPTDAPSDILFTLIEPYILYWLAEKMHCSGVLAVVVGGLYLSAMRMNFLNSTSRIRGLSVWESFVFLLNGIVFMIIGLQLPDIVAALQTEGIPLKTAIGYGLLVTLVLIVTRIISSYIGLFATIVFRPQSAPRATAPRARWLLPLILGWTGMRGVVSLAAALAIPLTLDNGDPFPQRNLILLITFEAILLSLLVQGLTLPWLIRRSKLFDTERFIHDEAEQTQRMKRALKHHIHHFLSEKYLHELQGHEGMQKFIQQWEERSKATDDAWMNEKTKRIFLELLETQRTFLIKLNKEPDFDEEIIRRQLYQLDLEEERLKIV